MQLKVLSDFREHQAHSFLNSVASSYRNQNLTLVQLCKLCITSQAETLQNKDTDPNRFTHVL